MVPVTTVQQAKSDPLQGMLLFHRSIRAALATFDDVARLAELGDVDVAKTEALYDFFTGPMRWHDLDERESLLRRLARADPQKFDDALRSALDEHECIERIVDDVLEHLRDMAGYGAWPDAHLLHDVARKLREVLEPHLEREEREVFPRARALLSSTDLDDIENEITMRRLRRLAVSNRRSA